MRIPHYVLCALSLLACSKTDPWAACRELGPPGFRADPPACTTDPCRACVDVLSQAWTARADPAQRNAFRSHFMRISADARDVFAARAHPDAPYPYEHCTAGTAPHASCAQLSPYCVGVIAAGLRSPDTSLAERTQYNLAAGRVCATSHTSLVTALTTRCEAIPAEGRCESAACITCMTGHLAAMSVVAPGADHEPGAAEMQSIVDATPEPVARAIAESLGAPEPPADLETVVVQRTLRAYCFSLIARSAAPPPYACNAVMNRFLTHPDYGDYARAWESVARALPAVRGHVVTTLLADVGRAPSLPEALSARLRTLPVDGTVNYITIAMESPAMSDPVYASLRELLIARGVTVPALPPVNRPSTPAAPASPDAGETSPRASSVPSGLRAPGGVAVRQG